MAKAQAGKTYVIIQDSRVHQIFTEATLAEWNGDQLQVIELGAQIPAEGDVWLGGTAFAPYVPPAKTQAEINAEADRMIAKHAQTALPLMLEVLTKLASGADKTALTVFDAAVKTEKAKKV